MSDAWRWAFAAWSRPGVEALCLELQNHHGQCPPLLLWRLWALETRRPVSAAALEAAARTTRQWHVQVVEPLRAARRALAAAIDGVEDAGRLVLRDRIRGAELAAERLLIETLDAMADAPAVAGAPGPHPTEALIAVAAAWGESVPADRLAALAAAALRPGP